MDKYIPFGPVRHIKTGKKYIFTNVVIDATNGRGDRKMCLYHSDGPASKLFVRDLEEFIEKFEAWEEK